MLAIFTGILSGSCHLKTRHRLFAELCQLLECPQLRLGVKDKAPGTWARRPGHV
jgi:hypothetical protein